jgi:protein-tyrosine phosphatase
MNTTDHTAINIDFDPQQQRMRGRAFHGDTPFDVPFISHITGNLWTGGCEKGLILPPHIDHVVSLYQWEQYRIKHAISSVTTVEMYDEDGEIDPVPLIALGHWVNECLRTGPTLVHCQAGLNRSAMVAATALILGGMMPNTAIALLRERRSPAVLCNRSFERFLREILPAELSLPV